MASNSIRFGIALRKNINKKSLGYGKYYVEKARTQTLTQRGLIKHMTEHGLAVPRSITEAVITQLAQCIPELCAQGIGVKLDSLGTFYPTVKSLGIVESDLKEDMDASKYIKGIHVRFLPDGTKLDDFTSVQMTRSVSSTLEGVKEIKTVGDKKVTVITDLDVYLASLNQEP